MAAYETEIYQLREELEAMALSAGKGAKGQAPGAAGQLGLVGRLRPHGFSLFFTQISHQGVFQYQHSFPHQFSMQLKRFLIANS